jgi:sulfatase maturation enzyme AslB (radical SAM superfamily)
MPFRLSDARFLPTGLAYLAASSEAWGPPLYFSIETINTCNLRCVYCPQSRPHEHFVHGHGRLSLSSSTSFWTGSRSVPARRVSLHRDGEPLLPGHRQASAAH